MSFQTRVIYFPDVVHARLRAAGGVHSKNNKLTAKSVNRSSTRQSHNSLAHTRTHTHTHTHTTGDTGETDTL